jgi:prolyl 4-hydroxylase
MQLQNFIRVFDDVVSKADCNKIIQEYEKRKSISVLHDSPAYKFNQLDLNATDMSSVAHGFVRLAIPYIRKYTEDMNLDRYVAIKGFEDVRIKKYLKNSDYEFKTHVDVDDRNSCVRYLIFMLYLNDNNGLTTFDNLNFSYKPKQGSMILFPPFWMFPHSGQTPTDHDKYIMMSSLHYT